MLYSNELITLAVGTPDMNFLFELLELSVLVIQVVFAKMQSRKKGGKNMDAIFKLALVVGRCGGERPPV